MVVLISGSGLISGSFLSSLFMKSEEHTTVLLFNGSFLRERGESFKLCILEMNLFENDRLLRLSVLHHFL